MKPAERVALLTALIAGAQAELDKAKAATLEVGKDVGVKTFDTPMGQVTIARKDAQTYNADPAALLAYVEHNYPGEVVTTRAVRGSYITALINRGVWVGDDFIDTTTGDPIPGMALSQPGDPYITWPASDKQAATKEEARAWFASQSEQILGAMRAVERAEP